MRFGLPRNRLLVLGMAFLVLGVAGAQADEDLSEFVVNTPPSTVHQASLTKNAEPLSEDKLIHVHVLGAVNEQKTMAIPPEYCHEYANADDLAQKPAQCTPSRGLAAMVGYLVAEAGGFTSQSKKKKVFIQREVREENGDLKVRQEKVRLVKSIWWFQNDENNPEFTFRDNDVVFVESQAEKGLLGTLTGTLDFVVRLTSSVAVPVIVSLTR